MTRTNLLQRPNLAARSARILIYVTASCGLAAGGGCGSDDEPKSAGAQCQLGETRQCVGPGACAGGQECLPDRSGFSACDCGSGGNGGTGGAAGAGANGGSGGSAGAGGSAGSTPDGSAGSSGGSAGADAGIFDAVSEGNPPGPLDDPCPGKEPYVAKTEQIDLNCSDQCQPTNTAACAAITSCTVPTSAEPVAKTPADIPLTIRLPANPAMTCPCLKGSGVGVPGALQYTLWFKLEDAAVAEVLYVWVDKPWYVVRLPTDSYDRCVDDGLSLWQEGCTTLDPVTVPPSGVWVGVGTNDPNAPSRTLIVRKAWAGLSCPSKWQ